MAATKRSSERAVSIVEAKDERPPSPGVERVQERNARIAHMRGPVGDGAKRTIRAGMLAKITAGLRVPSSFSAQGAQLFARMRILPH